MPKKSKKPTKSKKIVREDPFEAGLTAEQNLADTLCDQFLQSRVDDQEDIDEAFVGAFKGLSHRMLTIFKKEFVLELVQEMVELVEEDGEHVCDECKAAGLDAPVVAKDGSKLH